MSRRPILALVVLALGCGSAAEPAPATSAPATATANPTADTPAGAATPPAPATPPPPPAPPVDLLRSVRADIAVSSVYRDQTAQIARLTDGNLETAWNSRTGELGGAWIEMRVPASSTVTGIEMTVGFTATQGGSDLFAGNHRVSKVRVLRDGAEVLVHPLDPESRELQRIPAEGPGGVWRVEVVETAPGTRTSWREVCISEIRLMGRDSSAREGERFARAAVGALPPPRPEPGSHDRAAVAERLATDQRWFAGAWSRFERQARERDRASGEPDVTSDERASLTRTYRATLERVAELAELVDETRADRLRVKAAREVDWNRTEQRHEALREGLENAAAAFDAVAAWLNDPAARCAWARAHVQLRFERIDREIEYRRWLDDMHSFYAEDTVTREDRARTRAMERIDREVPRLGRAFRGDPAAGAAPILAYQLPADTPVQPDWDAIRSQIEQSRASCGW